MKGEDCSEPADACRREPATSWWQQRPASDAGDDGYDAADVDADADDVDDDVGGRTRSDDVLAASFQCLSFISPRRPRPSCASLAVPARILILMFLVP